LSQTPSKQARAATLVSAVVTAVTVVIVVVLALVAFQFRTTVAQMALEKAFSPSTMKPWAPGSEFKALGIANLLQQVGTNGGGCCWNTGSWQTMEKVFCSEGALSMLSDSIEAVNACTDYVKSRTEWPIKTFHQGLYKGEVALGRAGTFEIKSARLDPQGDGFEARVATPTSSDVCGMIAHCNKNQKVRECKELRTGMTGCP